MHLPHYLVHRASGYTFRLVVPTHLRAALGRTSVKHALHTHDPRRAQAWAIVLANRYRHAFDVLGSNGTMSDRDKLLRQLTGKTAAEIDEIGRVAPDDGTERRTPSPRPERQDPDQALAEAFGLDSAGGSKPYTLRRDAATGNVVEMSSDGPDDHARMMEAIRATAPIPAAPAPVVLPSVDDLLPNSGPPAGVSAITLRDAADEYITELLAKKVNARVKKTNNTRATAVRQFVECVEGGKSGREAEALLYEITRKTCGKFHALRLRTVIDSTAGNSLLWVNGFFEWAQVRGYYPEGDNPASGFSGQSKKKKDASRDRGWQRFETEQLRTIFKPENFKQLPGARNRWMVLIALYTGARSNEPAYLELRDIRQVEEGKSLWVFDFNARGEDKSLKNEESKRLTPIHPDLIALGLLERVNALREEGETRLFPDTNLKAMNGPANATQKAFTRLLEKFEIEPHYGKIGVHSFRDTVIQTMHEGGVRQPECEAYCGHVVSGQKSTQATDHVEAYTTVSGKVLANLAADCHPRLNWAQVGVVDIAAIKPLLFETKQPNPRHVRKR